VRADAFLSAVYQMGGRPEEAASINRRAVKMARDLGDTEGLFNNGMRRLILYLHGVGEFEERLRLAEELIQWPRTGVSAHVIANGLWQAGEVLLAAGERGRAEQCWREMVEIADRTQEASVLLHPHELAIVVATIDGN